MRLLFQRREKQDENRRQAKYGRKERVYLSPDLSLDVSASVFRVKPTDWNREPVSRNQVELLDPQGGAGGRGGPGPVLQEGAATTFSVASLAGHRWFDPRC